MTISCNVLAGITTPQTLKIEGYIKKKNIIVLIDLGSTCNFFHCKITMHLNYFLYPKQEFQVMDVLTLRLSLGSLRDTAEVTTNQSLDCRF